MITDFVPITKVLRNGRKTFSSGPSFQIVLSNNELQGIIINKKTAKMILDHDLLTQLREELWELNDPETVRMVRESRAGIKSDSISFDEFNKKHGI